MFGSTMLDVAIGMIFVYALVSVICTAIREGIEAWLKTRAAYLEQGIRQLLNDMPGTGLARQFYEHPLISGLYTGPYKSFGGSKRRRILASGGELPSYIPAGNFAAALLELAARGPTPLSANKSAPPLLTLENVRAGVANIENERVQRALLTAVDSAQGSLEQARRNLEAWFDSAMDRVSGWYKRSTHWILFWTALAVAVSMNINTIAIVNYLHTHEAAREAVVARAQTADASGGYDKAKEELQKLDLPIGWAGDRSHGPRRFGFSWDDTASPILGWLLTAFAATLGAPFWFDMLNKFMVIRSTVKPHEKSGEEASEDRQPKHAASVPAAAPSAAPAPVGPVAAPAAAPAPCPAPAAAPASAPASPLTATAIAGSPLADACDIPIADPTPDAELPAASGGVAA